MPVCVPVKDMKDTAAFARTVESAPGPVTVTRNGYDAFVVMRTDDYESMQQELARGHLLARAAQAERECAEGRYEEAAAFVSSLRSRHGL
ncbi:MAG: type II toxin-antitoxin system prevent-host-death family antitoxin [Slackia faecicanis]|nr:type II toxin-antitoxin system prevent-host-death family antitoxin [Slackia faecicanis]